VNQEKSLKYIFMLDMLPGITNTRRHARSHAGRKGRAGHTGQTERARVAWRFVAIICPGGFRMG